MTSIKHMQYDTISNLPSPFLFGLLYLRALYCSLFAFGSFIY
jgi:hypothetical protein